MEGETQTLEGTVGFKKIFVAIDSSSLAVVVHEQVIELAKIARRRRGYGSPRMAVELALQGKRPGYLCGIWLQGRGGWAINLRFSPKLGQI